MTQAHHPHVRRSEKERREILSRYEASGQSQRDFCKAEGIAIASFLRWRRQLGPAPATPRAAAKRRVRPPESPFVELIPAPIGEGWAIELALPGGCVLRVRP